MAHVSRPPKKRLAILSAVTSTIGGVGTRFAASSSLALLDVAHSFSSTRIYVHSSVPSVAFDRCIDIKDTGLHSMNNSCRAERTCALLSSTAICAGPNPFVNGPEGGQSEEDSRSASIPSSSSPFGFPPSNTGENGGGDGGDNDPSPNPFLQQKPPMGPGSNSPFGSGQSSPSNSGTTSGASSSPFGANKNNGFTSSNASGSPNPFQQPTQQQTPAAANPFGGSSMPRTATSEGVLGNNISSPPTYPSFPSSTNTNNNNVDSGVGLPKSPFAQSQDASFGGAQVNTNSPFGNNSQFGGGPPSLQTNDNNNNAFGSASASAMQPATLAASPPSAAQPADDTWLEFTIHPGHLPDPSFMTTTSTDYSNAIPRGLVLRTVKPGMRFGRTMTQRAEVAVSLGEEPIGQGIDDGEEPEKVWDLSPGEYVVNRGTRLDKTRMYVMDFEPSTTRDGGVVLRTINPGIVDEYGNNVRLAEVVVSGGPDGKWREPKPQMEGMEGVVGSSMMDGGAGAMGGVDGGTNRVSRGFVAFSSGSLGPARGGGGGNSEGGDGYTYGPSAQTGGDPYSLW